MLNTFTLETFSPRLGQAFVLQAGSREVSLDLVEAAAWRPGPTDPMGRGPFTLLFRGPGQPGLEQQTYRVSHPDVGEFALFLVPIGADADGLLYEAVFS